MNISFSVPPHCILREDRESLSSNPGGRWLPGAYVNPARDCLSLNSKKSLDDIVIRWRDEGSDALPISTMTFKELRLEVWYATFHLKSFF